MNLSVAVWGSLSRLAKDVRGQDLIEYALMGAFVAASAGFFVPSVTSAIGTVFSQIGTVMANAASQG